MRQKFIAWACVLGLAFGNLHCANPHTVERADNAAIGAVHQLALEKCYNDAIATWQTTQDRAKMDREYDACATAADKAAGKK